MKLQAKRGYTLVEAIIYLAILAGLAVIFIHLLFSLVQAYGDFRLTRDLVSSASLGLERLTREIRLAGALDPSTVLGVHPGRLVLQTTDQNGLPTTVDFFLSGAGALMIKQGSGPAASTTAALVRVDNLVFRQINNLKSQAVKVEMTLSASRGQLTRAEKFYTTAVLRGSY